MTIKRMNQQHLVGSKFPVKTLGLSLTLTALLLMALSLAAAHTSRAAPDACVAGPHSGNIVADQEWCAGDPHVVNGGVTVNAGVTLTIQAGVTVKFNSGTNLIVNGTLIAEGTVSQPITLTSASATPQAGDWRNIWAEPNAHMHLAYCDLGYAGQYNNWTEAAVIIKASDVQLRHCHIHHSTGKGVYLLGAGLSPTLENTQIDHISGDAIYQDTIDMTPVYHNLTLSDNGVDALVIPSSDVNRSITLDGSPAALNGAAIHVGQTAVSSGNVLTITPGTTLQFAGGGNLGAHGNATLIAEGTASQPITLTSVSATPQAGDWRNIWAEPNAHVRLAYCDLSYAGQYNNWTEAAVIIQASDVQLHHCRIHHSNGKGAYLLGGGLSPTLEDTQIDHNSGNAIEQNTIDMTPVYHNLTLSDNGVDALVIPSSDVNRSITLDGSPAALNGAAIRVGQTAVSSGNVLTITPGTTLQFAGGGNLGARGDATLIAEGTVSQPITLTSVSATPQAGDWQNLWVEPNAHVRLAYCDLSYAGLYNNWTEAAVIIKASDVQLRHCYIHHSTGKGVYLLGAGLSPTLEDTQIDHISGNAIYQDTIDMTPVYRNLSVSGNGTDAIVSAGGSFNRNATLAVPGTVDGTTLPYVWQGPVYVNGGYTLAIDPGVELRFPPGFSLELQPDATLLAEGTPIQPITFTTTISPAVPGSWRYVWFRSGSSASLAFCDLAYAGWSNEAALFVDSSAVQVEFCHIHHNQDEGIEVRSNAQPRLAYNRIEDNGFGLRNDTPSTQVDARHNWWGDATGPQASSNPGGLGNAVSDGVLFDPWLGPHAYFWREPQQFLLHGLETLAWYEFAALQPAAQSVDILTATAGQQSTLGTGLPRSGELTWDTTAHPDGLYELHALFRDASDQIVAHIVQNVAVNNSAAVAWHSGRLAADESWGPGVVHVVDEDLIVPGGITLTVQAGAVIKFEKGVGVTVEDGGVLDIQATGGAPVILTSLADDTAGGDTNLDGPNSIPLPGDWAGITIQGTGQANLNEFVDLRYVLATHAGALAGSETWNGTFVHRITNDVIVPSGATLTIEPGAVVKFDTGKSLIVNSGATLLAEGEVARPIVFTSIRDDSAGGDSNHDGDATAPAPGDWYRIYLDGSTASLDHVQLRYGAGTDSVHGALVHTNGAANLTIANSVLSDGLYTGLLAWGGPVTINNSLVTANDRGISAHPGSTVNVVNCTVDDNRINLLIHGGTLNTANTLVTHHFESGFQYDFGAVGTLRYNDAWSPVAGAVNYRNMADPTDTNGNVSTDPRYKDREGGNYRLQYLSPAIDAADGGLAPGTDFMGAPRYDDPRTPNTGLPTPGGSYADMGAFEFVETAESNIDLIVTDVQGPLAVMAGETVTVTWTVANRGSEQAVGPWHDTVSLVYNPELTPTVLVAGEVLIGQGAILGPGQTYQASAQVRVPGGVVADYYWQVETNTRGEVFEGQYQADNTTHSLAAVSLDVPELVIGGPSLARQFTTAGESHWFKFVPPAGQDVSVGLDRVGSTGASELYIGQGYMPTRQNFDAKYVEWNSPDVSAVLPVSSTETCYVLAYAQSLPGGAANFTISADILNFELLSVRPGTVGNAGPVTLELHGGQLRADMLYEIVDPSGVVYSATQVMLINSTLVYATFEMIGYADGIYDVRVRDQQHTASLPDCLTVEAGGSPQVWAEITGYNVIRIGREYAYEIVAGNVGNVDSTGFIAIGGVPSDATWRIVAPAPPLLNGLPVAWNDVITPIVLPDGLVLELPTITFRPGEVYLVRIVIEIPREENFTLSAYWIGWQ